MSRPHWFADHPAACTCVQCDERRHWRVRPVRFMAKVSAAIKQRVPQKPVFIDRTKTEHHRSPPLTDTQHRVQQKPVVIDRTKVQHYLPPPRPNARFRRSSGRIFALKSLPWAVLWLGIGAIAALAWIAFSPGTLPDSVTQLQEWVLELR